MIHKIIIGVIWILTVGLNMFLADWNSLIVDNRKKSGDPTQINHFVWGAMYLIFTCAVTFLLFRAVTGRQFWFDTICFESSLLMLHLSVFPVFYNVYQNEPPFNLSKTTTALTDFLMLRLGFKNSFIINLAAFISSVILIVVVL